MNSQTNADGSRLVAFFQRSNVFGGAEESLIQNALDFRERGWEVVIICFRAGPVSDRFESRGITVQALLPRRTSQTAASRLLQRAAHSAEVRSQNWNGRIGPFVASLVRNRELSLMQTVLKKLHPNAVYGNMCAVSDYQFLRVAARMGAGTVSHQRVTPAAPASRFVMRDMNEFCGELISNSEWTRTMWVNEGLRRERHEVVYNRIESIKPAKDRLRDRLGLNPEARLLASVGRIEAAKNFADGIAAFAGLKDAFADWHYVIIGEGNERPRLERMVQEMHLESRVHFTGEIPNARAHLGEVDLFLHPTRAEHFGRVVAEAMLSNTLVVGHASGGVTEMITDGESGFLFKEPDSLPEVLRRGMLNHENAAMKKSACERIRFICGPANSDRLAGLLERAAKPSPSVN